jgi:hypothetical protein
LESSDVTGPAPIRDLGARPRGHLRKRQSLAPRSRTGRREGESGTRSGPGCQG